jgi:hypothetical protein
MMTMSIDIRPGIAYQDALYQTKESCRLLDDLLFDEGATSLKQQLDAELSRAQRIPYVDAYDVGYKLDLLIREIATYYTQAMVASTLDEE